MTFPVDRTGLEFEFFVILLWIAIYGKFVGLVLNYLHVRFKRDELLLRDLFR